MGRKLGARRSPARRSAIRLGWIQTTHPAYGAAADRVIMHLESFRANTVDAASAYVAISRARDHAAIYTDKVTQAIGVRDAMRVAALDQKLGQDFNVGISD
jgi:ATP-dependent exoDNAse (exonuclease V) alpha subunit